MTKLAILRWSILGCFLLLGLLPTAAHASDCPPDDPSRSDCKSAASTARSPLVPIAGAAAGAGAGWVVTKVLDPGARTEADGEQEPETRGDPCQADLDRYAEAAMRARVFQASREGFQNLLTLLETLYENARQAAFWSSSLDVAFMAGSLWTKPAAALLGRQLVEQTLGQKLREALLKSFGQELTKSLMTSMDQQGIDWGQVAAKGPGKSVFETGLQEGLTKTLVNMEMERFAIYGIRPGGPVAKALEQNVANEVAGPLVESVFGVKALIETAQGAAEGADKLQQIRAQMSQVRKNLMEANAEFDDALEDMALARSTLEHCRKIWALK